ncbi:hypothetical protein D3C87_110430 [compost metagenome]
MNQKINGYHKDFENHWVAELECGHAQHVRHDPPWMERLWVTTEEGRNSRLGHELNCVRCDEMGMLVAKKVLAESKQRLIESYENAGISGLCGEGRWEIAIQSVDSLDLKSIVSSALRIDENNP